jgi:large subunit ribosomal protein L31
MKKSIHPEYKKVEVVCLCGNKMELQSTTDNIRVELCYKCHPFYTGEQKIVDSANRVKRFTEQSSIAEKKKDYVEKQKIKKEEKKGISNPGEKKEKPILTLRDMMDALK